MTPDERLARWRSDIEEISQGVGTLLLLRKVFKAVRGIIKANPKLKAPNLFKWFLHYQFVATMSVGIRRFDDPDGRTRSLLRLLQEMADNHTVVTRGRYVADFVLHVSGGEGVANAEFNNFAGGTGDHLDPARIRQDIEQLKADCRAIHAFVDKRVAHLDRDGTAIHARIADQDKALGRLELLVRRYLHILTGADVEVEPTILEHWEHIFTFPWIAKEEEMCERS